MRRSNEELVEALLELLEEIGWNAAFVDDTDPIQGMIIGTEEFIGKLIQDENVVKDELQ